MDNHDPHSLILWLINYMEKKSYRTLTLGHDNEWVAGLEIPFILQELHAIKTAFVAQGDIK